MTTRLAICAGVFGLLLAAPAHASCIPSTERDYVKRADAIFVGRVLSVRSRDGRATFRVLRVKKGRSRITTGSLVRVYPWPYRSSVTLNWKPRRGQRWRVYVQRKGHRWITSDCLGTRRA
jgi:hypothetical protein